MKKILLFSLFFTSPTFAVSGNPSGDFPLSKTFWSLFQERSVLGENDCSNKCGRYVRALLKEGYKADIVIVQPHRSRFPHAVVQLALVKDITYLDPSKGIISKDLETLGHFKEFISSEKLDELGDQYR